VVFVKKKTELVNSASSILGPSVPQSDVLLTGGHCDLHQKKHNAMA